MGENMKNQDFSYGRMEINMIYPKYLKKGDVIGIAAPSDGNKRDTDYKRLDNGKLKLHARGYKVIETASVRTSEKGRSADAITRAKEFEELLDNKEVSLIASAKGGDFLMEMLSKLDFDKVVKNPKWFMGYSDNTSLTYVITTKCDIATVYGNNFNDFGMDIWHSSVENSLSILEGKEVVQNSFDRYEDGFMDRITGLESYVLEKEVKWRNISGGNEINMSGRMLGGCLDVLLNLVGTRFDNTKEFLDKYKKDGFIWYLESFSLDSESISRGLWQLKEAGWFEGAKGFIFGRPAFFNEEYYIPYEEAVLSILNEMNVPIILDADIGHKAPQMTIINGSIGNIYSSNGKGRIAFNLV